MPATFDPLAHPDRLNLGCGYDIREGFLNVDLHDFHSPDLAVEVLAQDVLEHLPRTETLSVLREWNRVMAIGGTLELRIPSLLDLTKLFADERYAHPNGHEMLLQLLFGTQAYTGDTHLTSFTRPLLEHYFAEAGFEAREWGLRDEWLFEIVVEKVADAPRDELGEKYARLLANREVDSFLDDAYRELLGREPDPEGRYHWAQSLRSGAVSYRQVIETLAAADET
jgi:predicted SAM-dependent methyltransferase